MPSSPTAPSSPPDPPRACLDALPTELLKRIVDYAAKDRTSAYVTLSKGGSQRDKLQLLASCDPRWTMVATHWTAAYGREIESLSKFNKRLRRLTMPLILETVSCKQLASPTALYRILETPFVSSIRSLDLSSVPKDTSYIDIAQIFPLLPAVDTLSVDAESIVLLFKVTPRSARRSIRGRDVGLLAARPANPPTFRQKRGEGRATGRHLAAAMQHVEAAALCIRGHLEGMWHEETTTNQEFRAFLVSLTALESLEIEEVRLDDLEDGLTMPVTPRWREEWRMPSVRLFKVSTFTCPANIVPLFAKALPGARTVLMRFRPPYYEGVDLAQYLAEVPPVRWPALESFAFDGHVNLIPILLFALKACSTLQYLDLSPGQPDFAVLDHVWHILPGTAPANVRHITFRPYNADCIPLPLRMGCESWCETRRIAFSWRYRQSLFGDVDDGFFWRNRYDDNQLTRRSSALVGVLIWAGNHLQHLTTTNDTDGLDEMVKLLRPLQERRHIERGLPEAYW